MKLRHLAPFVILMAWQAAPFPRDSDPPRRRFSLSLGYAMEQLEDYTPATFNCDGSMNTPERSEQVEVRSAGARADMVTSGGLRVTAFGGSRTTPSSWAAGPFGGVEVAYEGPRFGMGAGVTRGMGTASTYTATSPSLYLRVGHMDAGHFRLELLPATESGVAGLARAGIGFNQGSQDRVGGFVGAGVVPAGGNGQVSLVGFADLSIPTGSVLDLLVRSQIGQGHQYTIWGLGLGARYHFGR